MEYKHNKPVSNYVEIKGLQIIISVLQQPADSLNSLPTNFLNFRP